jgi:uncharacterized membrane protein YfcA
MELAGWINVAAVLVAGAAIQSTAGFGLGMFAIPVLMLLGMPSYQAIPVCTATAVLQAGAGLWQLREHIAWRETLPWVAVPLLTVPAGIWIQARLVAVGPDRTRQVYGALILVALLSQMLWRVQPRERLGTATSAGALLTAGVMTGTAGMGGPAIVLWVMAHSWSAERSRTTLWLLFVFIAPLSVAMLAVRFGAPTLEGLRTGLLLAPVTLLGLVPGLWIGRRISKPALRQLAYVILALVSLYAIIQPLI